MHSRTGDENMNNALRALRARMANNALHHLHHIDLRASTVLQRHGLIEAAEPEAVPETVLGCMADPNHGSRVPTSIGPMLFMNDAEGTRSAIRPLEYVEHPHHSVRVASQTYFARMVDVPDAPLTPRSRNAFKGNVEAIASDDFDRWWPAAKIVSKALGEDYLLNVAGLRQCTEVRFEEGINDFLIRVMRPTATSLDTIQLEAWGTDGKRHTSRESDFSLGERVQLAGRGMRSLSAGNRVRPPG